MNPEPNKSIVIGVEPSHNGIIVHIARDARFYPDALAWPIQSVEVPDEALARISEIISLKVAGLGLNPFRPMTDAEVAESRRRGGGAAR